MMSEDLYEVIIFIQAIPNWERFKKMEKDELIMFHRTLGMIIRNHLMLWERKWTPELVDGVDVSENHPDAISMRLIENAWEYLQTE